MAGRVGVAQLDGWVMVAQARARLVYGCGHHHRDCVRGVPERAYRLYELGLIIINHVRTDDPCAPFDFVATRTEKPAPTGLSALKPLPVPTGSAGLTIPPAERAAAAAKRWAERL